MQRYIHEEKHIHLISTQGSAGSYGGPVSLYKQNCLDQGEHRKIQFHCVCEQAGSEVILSNHRGKVPEIINKAVKPVQWPDQMWHSQRMCEQGIFKAADFFKKGGGQKAETLVTGNSGNHRSKTLTPANVFKVRREECQLERYGSQPPIEQILILDTVPIIVHTVLVHPPDPSVLTAPWLWCQLLESRSLS